MSNLLKEKEILNSISEDFETGYDLLLKRIKFTQDKIKLLENMYDTAKKYHTGPIDRIHNELEIERELLRLYVGIKIRQN